MNNKYTIRRAKDGSDSKKLHTLFNQVFHPEEVGVLAETMFNHLPGMEHKYWFIAEEKETGTIVSAFALIPWTCEIEGIQLKVAEMGIVGTLEEHQRQGLFSRLNQEFDQVLEEEGFDFAMIQGIPGFYTRFGYAYALPLENQINLPLHLLPEQSADAGYTFRLANQADIPALMQADEQYRAAFSLSTYRDAAHWQYMLTEGLKTEYGSEYWIITHPARADNFYCRIPAQGFGTGLIVSEISADITDEALNSLLAFCKQSAIEKEKPYVRLNLHNDSFAGKMAIAMGAKPGNPYAWQIKFPDPIRYLTTIAPLLEQRIQASAFKQFSGTFRLDFYNKKVDLLWENGQLKSVQTGAGESQLGVSIHADLFTPLCLGHKTWQELRAIRPEMFPHSAQSALFIETLFPAKPSWFYEQY